MSSWLVSLRWIEGSAVWRRQYLEEHRLHASRLGNGLLSAGPCRPVREPRPEKIQQGGNLAIVHAVGKARHDGTAFALHRPNPRQHGVGRIARIWAADGGRQTKIDPA